MASGTFGAFLGGDSGDIELTPGCFYRKVGRQVVLWFAPSTTLSTNSNKTWKEIGTLPTGYRPANTVYAPFGAGGYNSTSYGTAKVEPSGKVSIVSQSGEVIYIAGEIVFFV